MTAPALAPYRSAAPAGHDGFAQLVRAEWTKLRTVRGWVIGMIVAGLLTAGVGLLSHGECGSQTGPSAPVVTGCTSPLGPGGEAVTDGFYFVHQPLAGDGSITVRVTSMTGSYSPDGVSAQDLKPGLQPWSKAGIIIKAAATVGSPYAAMMVTGSHGVRMQWNYTNDVAGLGGAVSAASPRWLRLTRSGDTVTGYDSPDGAHWSVVGTTTLTGLPGTVPAGLFAASPDYAVVTSQSIGGGSGTGGPSQATAAFDQVTLQGAWPVSRWTGTIVGGPSSDPYPVLGYRQSGGRLVVSGSGDIAPVPPSGEGSVANTLVGAFAGLIAVVIVASMFITAEYQRGLILLTLTASPRRSRILAAKAVVVGLAAFAVALPAAFAAPLIEEPLARSRGIFIYPVPVLTQVRVVAGTAALLAVAAVLALALGALLRRSAIAVTAVIAVIVLPYFFADPLALLPAGAADWLLRVTPAAGFAIQQPYPAYPQVIFGYTPGNGYYPLAPVGRLRGAVRLDGTGAGTGHVPAATERRMSASWVHESGLSRVPGSGLGDAVAAEWTKARTLASTGWLLLAAVVATVAVSAAVAGAVTCPAGNCAEDPAKISLTGLYLGQAVVAILAVLMISSEYSTGMIRVTLAAMPRRTTVLTAKAAILTGLVLAAGAIAVLGCVLAGQIILRGHGIDPAHGYPSLSLGSASVLRAAGGSVLYLALIAWLSLGIAAAVRDSAAAIGVVLGVLYLFPIVGAVLGGSHLARLIQQIGPMTAGLAIQATTGLGNLPIGPWAGLGVLAAWAAAALLAGGLLLRLRDA